MDTDKAEALLRSYYAMRTAEARASGPHGRVGDHAATMPRTRRGAPDRYARLDSPRFALATAAAALVVMAGIGLACQSWDSRPLSTDSLIMLSELRVGADGLGRAIAAIRSSAPTIDQEGERL
jgi:hypothetical protein